MTNLAATTVIPAKFEHFFFPKSNCSLVAVSVSAIHHSFFSLNPLKSSLGQAFLRRNRFGLQPPLCGNMSVCVSRCVTCTYTLPFLRASCMTTPQSQPHRWKKGKPTLGKSASVSAHGPSRSHSEASEHFHGGCRHTKGKCFYLHSGGH